MKVTIVWEYLPIRLMDTPEIVHHLFLSYPLFLIVGYEILVLFICIGL
jgi:hypothetical protein